MKMVCIKLDNLTFNPKLYEICEVEIDYNDPDKFWEITHYLVKPNNYYYPVSCFMSLDEYREKQIDLIIN